MTDKKLYRIHVHAEIDARFEVEAATPDDAALKTYDTQPKDINWLTPGRVVAIEEKTPDGWKAATPEETALIQEVEQ